MMEIIVSCSLCFFVIEEVMFLSGILAGYLKLLETKKKRLFVFSLICVYVLQVGAALTFDLLKYDEDTLTALLRVYSR